MKVSEVGRKPLGECEVVRPREGSVSIRLELPLC